MSTLLIEDRPVLWSIEELNREFRSAANVTNSLGRLTRAGLVHRIDAFVFASRAAAEFDQLSAS